MLEQQRNQDYFNAIALFSFSLILSLNDLHEFFNAFEKGVDLVQLTLRSKFHILEKF